MSADPTPTAAEHQLLATLRERGTLPERISALIAGADELDATFVAYEAAELGTRQFDDARTRWLDGCRSFACLATAVFQCGDPDPDPDPDPDHERQKTHSRGRGHAV